MTSKFSHTNKTQKPPSICIKPPPGPEYKPPELPDQSVQGFAQYFDPATGSEGGMISAMELFPMGPPDIWFGTAAAGSFEIKLLMAADTQRTFLSFLFNWYVYGDLVQAIEIDDHRPRSWAPFDTGVVTPHPQPQGGRSSWRFWF
ncbi:hypothetical protein LCGC14_1195140 [marine sediment metagenome]|uniref:Uncharacterized protein n=1 Tax=marine sediment metagenome TaxID=412755 RepID=A0A0F9M5X0_9ZZZZ